MKKSYIALAVLAMAALVGCQEKEFGFNDYVPEEGEIVFRISNNSKMTKSSDEATVNGMTFELGKESGTSLFLTETITNLDMVSYSPETKGTPGFTENFNKLYNGFDAIVFRKGETTPYENGGRFELVPGYENVNLYKRKYPNSLWDKGGLYFFLNAYYKNGSMAGVSALTPHMETEAAVTTGDNQHPEYKVGDISFQFNNSTLSSAEQQSDLLFTSRPVNSETEYQKLISKTDGIDVLFHHALTGVKFRVGNNNNGSTKTVITRVEISGLYDKGFCVITPDPENSYKDVKYNNYSSSSAVKWYNLGTSVGSFSQDYTNPTYVVDKDNPENNKNNPDGTVSTSDYQAQGQAEGGYVFGSSWYDAAADNNLNLADGSQTFWFIPQSFKNEDETARDVTLKVTFRVKTPDTPNGTEITHTIKDFGSKLAAKDVEWKAGELRTYTLNPLDVDVEIFDTMSGKSKTNLHVTNTGNVSEYIRMLVIGNWYGWESEADQNSGKEPEILVGYKYAGNETADQIAEGDNIDTMMDPWYREDPQYGQYFDATFTNGNIGPNNKWLRGTTGFYYPYPIGPGQTLDSQTEALFKSYVWPDNVPFPTIYIPDPNSNVRKPAVGVHLIMEVAVQAIGSKKPDGTNYADCWEAWTAAIYPNGGGTIGPK